MKTLKTISILILAITLINCSKDDPVEPQGLTIGSFHEGGIIFSMDLFSGSGLVCAVNDQSSEMRWGYNNLFLDNTKAIRGSGATNTQNIATAYPGIENAADLCLNLDLKGYSDWFLPSKDELNLMYENRDIIDATAIKIGGHAFSTFIHSEYWSSTEENASFAWFQGFDSGIQKNNYKTEKRLVRAVRAFYVSK